MAAIAESLTCWVCDTAPNVMVRQGWKVASSIGWKDSERVGLGARRHGSGNVCRMTQMDKRHLATAQRESKGFGRICGAETGVVPFNQSLEHAPPPNGSLASCGRLRWRCPEARRWLAMMDESLNGERCETRLEAKVSIECPSLPAGRGLGGGVPSVNFPTLTSGLAFAIFSWRSGRSVAPGGA